MDLFRIACGTKANPKWLTLARCNRDPIAKQMRQAVDEGARKVDDLEENDIYIFDRKPEQDLCCIHLLRLSGYTVVLQPLIPDFGYEYTTNMNMWSANPSVRTASHGSMVLLDEIRIFKTGHAAKRYHAKKLAAWRQLGTRNACVAPPVIRYRADLWPKVRALASYIHKVQPYAMFWMEEAAKRSMCAEFDEEGRPQLIGRGAKCERDAAMEMPILA